MKSFSLLDVVVLIEDMPSMGLKAGMKGVVVHIFSIPIVAYEVEFCDNQGQTITTLALRPEQLEFYPS